LTTLSGQGGSCRDGGRWNKTGHSLLYFGLLAATVMLEMGNYTSNPRRRCQNHAHHRAK